MKHSIIKPLLLVCIILFSVAAKAAAENRVDIGTVEGTPGDIVELQIGLTNSDNVSSVQVSIPLDARIEVVENSAQTTSRTAQHNVTAGVKDGKLNLFVYSLSMGDIAPGSGAIATVKLKLGNDPLRVALSADKVVLTDKSGVTLSDCSATDGTATILCAKAEYSTMAIDYGRVPIRSTYQQTVSVSNVGNAPLKVSGLQFSAAEFSCAETFPVEIQAGESKVFTLAYAPVERGGITEEVKFINNSIYKLNTVKLKAQPFAVNELHVEDASGVADSTVTLSLRMNNMDAITGFQFDFTLPEQLVYIDGSFELSSRKADHQTGVSLEGNTLRVLAYSLSDSPFSGNDGTIATFKVRLNGRYGTSLGATKAVLTANIKGQLTDVLSDKYEGYINILSPSISATTDIDMGRTPITQDAKTSFRINNYGSAPLRVERIVTSTEHLKIAEKLPLVVQPWNGIDVEVVLDDVEERDYSELIQLYTNDPDCRLHNIKVKANRYSPNYITLSGADVEPGDTLRLQVALSNNDVVNGVQLDMEYDPSNFEILDKYEWSERAEGFTATSRNIGNRIVRYFCYSLGGSEIAKGDGNIMTIKLLVKKDAALGSYEFNVSNILLSTPGLTNKYSGSGNSATINVVKPVRTVSIATAEHGSVSGAGRYDLGASATLTATPDEGYSFASWSDGNSDNPRVITVNDNISLSVRFVPNSYTLKYVVDGEDYDSQTLEYGATIMPEENPSKAGYTFSGWSEIPETMPAHDVTVIGSFTVNSHKVTWKIGSETIAETDVDYGEAIIAPEVPDKEGYEFEGWDEYPQTMPDYDITITGRYKVLTGIAQILGHGDGMYVYTLQGVLVGRNLEMKDFQKLPKGIYIVNGKKVVNK